MRRKLILVVALLLALFVLAHLPHHAAAQEGPTYIPMMRWPVPDEYRWVMAFPDEAYTWELLGLVPGKSCPSQSKRDREPSRPFWRDEGTGEESDWAQASRGVRKVACYWHHAGTDIFVDPGTPVYAVAEGTITAVGQKPNEAGEINGYVEATHFRVFRGHRYEWKVRYLHLQLNPPVTPGPIADGALLGYVIYRKDNTHLHYEVDDFYATCPSPNCITNPWGPMSLWIDYDDIGGIDPATNGLSIALDNTNLVRNSSFDEGAAFWAQSPGIQIAAQSGTLIASRQPNNELAWLRQVLPYRFAAGTPIEAELWLGNSSGTVKYVGATVRDPETSIGAITCLFAIPPNTPPQRFIMQGTIPAEWRNALLHLTVNPADGIPGVIFDLVAVMRDDSLSAITRRCAK